MIFLDWRKIQIEISKKEELKIIELYEQEKYSLRRIAKIFNTDYHRINRILKKNNIEINNDNRAITSKRDIRKDLFQKNTEKILGWHQKGERLLLERKCQNHHYI